MKLKDKVALITGGDSGIGRAVAVLYAREGADLAIVYLPEEQQDAEETKRAVENEGRECLLISGDVSDAGFCRRAVSQTVRRLGQLDILVNNAAYQHRQEGLEKLTEEQYGLEADIGPELFIGRVGGEQFRVGCFVGAQLAGAKPLLDEALGER